jgi:acyl-CoA reductase-like NAD-dependent aldehyde dehydrogenase
VNDLDDVTEILNQTQYGMVSAIYTAGKENYLRLVEEVHVGLLHWNRPTTTWAHQVATGGIKKSGNARPMGKFAVRQCTYPMSSLEYDGTLPATFPKVEGSK